MFRVDKQSHGHNRSVATRHVAGPLRVAEKLGGALLGKEAGMKEIEPFFTSPWLRPGEDAWVKARGIEVLCPQVLDAFFDIPKDAKRVRVHLYRSKPADNAVRVWFKREGMYGVFANWSRTRDADTMRPLHDSASDMAFKAMPELKDGKTVAAWVQIEIK